jgi:NAD(P)-binding Rossmann-like domain
MSRGKRFESARRLFVFLQIGSTALTTAIHRYRIGMTMSAKNLSDDTSTPRPSQPTSSRPPTSRVALKNDIVVIGAGQAGLSSAYHLKKRGLAPGQGFIVLDQSPRPGGAWQFRWPSLKLSTVNRIHDLPGMRFSEAVDTEATEVEASVAVPRYFAAYEEAFDLPVYGP